MNTRHISLLGAMLLLAGCATHRVAAPKTSDRSIVVVYDNDVHCAIDGYSLMAGYRDAVSDTSYVAMVSSGDYLQGGTPGAISHGEYIADIMKTMKYDAVTLGNHEFDYGTETMFRLLDKIGAPVTCVNLRDMQDHQLFAPYVIREFGNRKVAFIGAVTPTTLYTEAYSFYDDNDNQLYHLSEKDVYQRIQEQVDAVRKLGADYVIILSHLGEDDNPLNVYSHGLAAASHGIDVILDGHSHNVVPHVYVNDSEGKPVLVTQTGTKFQNIGRLVIMPNGKMETKLVPLSELSRRNEMVKAATDSVVQLADNLVKRPICQSDVKLRILDENGRQAVRKGETNAGDLVTDAYRIVTGADLAITNGGGIRTELNPGLLTYGDMVSMLPYDNYVCVVEATGHQIMEVLRANTKYLPVEFGSFPQVSGLKYTVMVGADDPVIDVQVLDAQTGEYKPIDLDHTYRLATIDYCITGGGLEGILKKSKVILPSLCVYNECLIRYVTEHLNGRIGQQYAEPQGRITINYPKP